MVETAVDEIPGLGVLDVIERLGLDAFGDFAVDLSLVGALGVRIFLCDLDVGEEEHSRPEHKRAFVSQGWNGNGSICVYI